MPAGQRAAVATASACSARSRRGNNSRQASSRVKLTAGVGQLVERARLIESEAADPGAPQRSQVAPDAQRRAEIAGQRADVGSRRAVHLDVDIDQRSAAPHRQHLEPVDAHRPAASSTA